MNGGWVERIVRSPAVAVAVISADFAVPTWQVCSRRSESGSPSLWEFGEPPFFWAVFVLFNGYYNWIYGVSDKMAGVQYSRLASKLLI